MGLISFIDNPQIFIILIISLIFSLCLHEFSHAIVAYYCGDDTAYRQGRITLNPLNHLDPYGSLFLLFVGFGWAKPVPVNTNNLKNKKYDIMKIAFAGPASNILLALIGCIILNYTNGIEFIINGVPNINETMVPWYVSVSLYIFSSINVVLAVFNLLPIAPLDGSQIFGSMIKEKNPQLAYALDKRGPFILMMIVFFGILTGYSLFSIVISPITNMFFKYVANIQVL